MIRSCLYCYLICFPGRGEIGCSCEKQELDQCSITFSKVRREEELKKRKKDGRREKCASLV